MRLVMLLYLCRGVAPFQFPSPFVKGGPKDIRFGPAPPKSPSHPQSKSGLFVNQVSTRSALSPASFGTLVPASSADYDSVEWTSVGRSVLGRMGDNIEDSYPFK